jgi:hypothetical protein
MKFDIAPMVWVLALPLRRISHIDFLKDMYLRCIQESTMPIIDVMAKANEVDAAKPNRRMVYDLYRNLQHRGYLPSKNSKWPE